MKVAAQSNPGVGEQFMHKNRLQEYAQRSAMQLPVYQTFNEGSPHAPQFRSTVLVDGIVFKSPSTFSHRKAAEQHVAKIALEGVSMKLKNEGIGLIYHDTSFCKSILNEFAVKVNLEKPKYVTSQAAGLLPMFFSSVVFDGKVYTGGSARNKKDAEQLAARTVIESILGGSNKKAVMSQIIKSKGRLYAAVDIGNGSQGSIPSLEGPIEHPSNISLVKGKEVQVDRPNDKLPVVPYFGSLPSIPPANNVAKHFNLRILKEEYVTNQSSGSVDSHTCAGTHSQGDPVVRSTSAGLVSVPNGSYATPRNDLQDIRCATPSVLPTGSHNDDSNSKRKCSQENNESLAKKARNEQLLINVPKEEP